MARRSGCPQKFGGGAAIFPLDQYTPSVYFLPMNSKEVIKKIVAEGWEHVRTTGDHWHFRHASRPGTCTVPHPKKDMPLGTLKSIEKQSGVRLR